MKAKMFRALLPLAIVFTMVSCSSDSEEATTDKKVVTTYNYNETESKLVVLINDYRASLGLNTLEVINHISYKSEEHNYYMIDNNVFNHDYFQQRSDNLIRVLGAEKVGENIAYNYQTAESAFAAWLSSPGHKDNIEGDYTHLGISVTTNPDTGRKYYTNMFIKK
ncbi:CAP domain-containing protein [Flavobacterium sp. J49]|uniref:CAP domain-containing protein n=1 Tax=Flavobacterium sp. J49 TaxID=2718534 RepID=UPI001593D5CC|nr:CAP domain-containing protein [Flavobacterium sp. J49]MBF6640886.1 CAP domain-containing protein [Flavobacterium sp. J49]NIC02133.1 CAP domain-containing protein [Flavobacterium sp. J49]